MPPIEPPRGPLATRMVTLEAAVLLLCARFLVAAVRFGRWRPLLGGTAVSLADDRPADGARPGPLDRYLAKAVDRVADRLPLLLRCLPRAVALHWMLHRRGRPTQLVIAALPRDLRGDSDALHAWVESGGEFLIGRSEAPHRPLLRLSFELPR